MNYMTNGNGKNELLRPYEPLVLALLRILDASIGTVAFLVLTAFFATPQPYAEFVCIVIFCMSLIVFHLIGLYRSWRFSPLRNEISHVISGCFLLYGVFFFIAYFFHVAESFSRLFVICWMLSWPVLMSAERVLIRLALRHYRRRGLNQRKAVIVGAGELGLQLARSIKENPWSGTRLMGFFDDRTRDHTCEFSYLGSLKELPAYVARHGVDIVYMALPFRAEAKIQDLVRELHDSTVSIYFAPDIFFLNLVLGGNLVYFDNFPMLALQDTPIKGVNALVKRTEDIILAGVIFLLTLPLFGLIALGIKLTSRGPIFFKQWRCGLNGQNIQVLKFRTMTVCEDGFDFNQAVRDDERVTPFGAFLRKSSLDELPQFLNVIQGTMSLVGPRPHPVAMNEAFRKVVPGYMLRHKVKPGITGLAQVNGFRGETDTLDKMEKRVKYDLEYLRQWSIFMDLKIILLTVFNGAWWKNAY